MLWCWFLRAGVQLLPVEVPQELHKEEESQEDALDQGLSEGGRKGDGGGKSTYVVLESLK